MNESFITVENIVKSFYTEEKNIEVLRGISLVIEQGEKVAILGSSGAGKSTFLHLLGTLDKPTSGKIIINQVNVADLSSTALAKFRNRTIGFMFQFHHLLPEFSALENVAMPALIAGTHRAEALARSEELLRKVNLQQRLTHRPGQLSGGEQQRVALARALIMQPSLLLADEPTGNLDTKTSEEIHELMLQINQENNTTLVVVTHNQTLAKRLPRNIFMKDGLLVEN